METNGQVKDCILVRLNKDLDENEKECGNYTKIGHK